MIAPGSLLNLQWCESHEAKDVFYSLFHRSDHSRKSFGLLEKPSSVSGIEEVKYKVFLVGKSSVGKTSTVCKLAGHHIPSSHSETAGVQVTTVYWPVKITHLNKVMMFNLQFWDSGENSLKKYDHILSACTDRVDGMIFLFSFIDKGSFDEIPQYLTKLTNPEDNICKLVLGTKFDQHAESEVTQRDIKDFETNWKIPILRTKNIPTYDNDIDRQIAEVAPVLNGICEYLWHRDVLQAQNKQRHPEKAFF